jgi:hypothetical protein
MASLDYLQVICNEFPNQTGGPVNPVTRYLIVQITGLILDKV